MYVIVVYDIEQKRVTKMLKLCRKYLHWVQNSVFEGEITAVKLKELVSKADAIMTGTDSLIIFKSRHERWLDKEVHGAEKNKPETIL